ncbi:MAG TPA: DUF4194 domain-containing protein [Planctomycetota bacterium]|nr:DUF4194 domain-containing protein [Planctomycetota bacterium]
MDFLDDYPKLEPAQRDRFQQVVTRLLAGEIITPGTALKPEPDWRFTERYGELIDSYLRFGGWRLDLDPGLRLARAVHESGAHRVRFSKLESLLLCMLRLLYHEQMQRVSEDDRCEISVGVLRERLVHAGKPVVQLSARQLAPALRRLAAHSLVQVVRGFEAADDELVAVSPLIEKILPPDRIQEYDQRIRDYLKARAPAAPVSEARADDASTASGAGEVDDEKDEESST